jgi:hypothetical protein
MGNLAMISKQDDAQVVKDVIVLPQVDVLAWIQLLGIDDLEALLVNIGKYKKNPLADTSLRSYATFLPLMTAIED